MGCVAALRRLFGGTRDRGVPLALERPPAHSPVYHELANQTTRQAARTQRLMRDLALRERTLAEVQRDVWQEGGHGES